MGQLNDRLLNVMRVKTILACSKSHVYNLIHAGKLDAVKIGGKNGLRVKESSLTRFMEQHRVDVGA